jgi:pimeloyl-ACP methyl ester carboxylesterase
MSKNVVFVPGYEQTYKDYPRTMKCLDEHDARVYPVELDWSDEATPQKWGVQVGQQVDVMAAPEGATLLGHSFGAVAAIVEAAARPERYGQLIVCSLTPVGREDLITDLDAREYYEGNTPLGRYDSFSILALDSLLGQAQQIARRAVLVGGLEVRQYSFMDRRARKAAQILGTSVITIGNAPHFMDYDHNYVQTVVEQI